MELIKKNIHMENRKNGTSLQMNLDGDYNFLERNPDAVRIVQKKATIKTDEIKEYEDFILCKGRFCYEILYLTESEEHSLCSAIGELPFEEQIRIEKIEKGVTARIHTELENFSAKLINGRKIHIQTLFHIRVNLDELQETELTTDISESDAVEMKKEEWEYAKILSSKKELVKIKEEFVVPEGYANIGKLIWKNVKILDLDYTAMEGKIQFQAILNVFFMYEAEDLSVGIQSFELSKAITGFIDCPECGENVYLWVEEYSKDFRVECRQDLDGEDRILYLELELYNFVKIYQNNKELFVTDAYGISRKMDSELKEVSIAKILNTIKGQIKLEEECSKGSNISDILRTDVEIISVSCEYKNGELCIKGFLQLNLLCKMDLEEEQYTSIARELPFEYAEAKHDLMEKSQLNIVASVQQFHSFVGSDQINFNGIIQYKIMPFESLSKKVVTNLIESEEGDQAQLPTVAVIFVDENEKIWDIGKKYQISMDGIRRLNDLKSDHLAPGQKIMIARERV